VTGTRAATAARLRYVRGIVVLLVSVLLLIEIALHALLGNYGITRLYEYGPSDGRCVGLRHGTETDYTGWLFRISPVHLAVNEDGYRGPRRPPAKAADTYRILLLGDSYAFGQAVNEPDTISAQLEGILGYCGNRRVEVLNFGVPGLNMEEVLDQYRRFASRWTHDLALYLAFKNDLDGPMCRAHRSYGILDSRALQSLNQHLYLTRFLYIVFMIGAAEREPSDPSARERLRVAQDGMVDQARRSGAKLGIVVLGDPLLKQSGQAWHPVVPTLDVSYLVDSAHVVRGDFHLDGVGNRILATEVASWVRANFCRGPISLREVMASEKP
jgi:hypothetical protein